MVILSPTDCLTNKLSLTFKKKLSSSKVFETLPQLKVISVPEYSHFKYIIKFLIDQAATKLKSGGCLINQAASKVKSGGCLIDQEAARLKSGCLIDQDPNL